MQVLAVGLKVQMYLTMIIVERMCYKSTSCHIRYFIYTGVFKTSTTVKNKQIELCQQVFGLQFHGTLTTHCRLSRSFSTIYTVLIGVRDSFLMVFCRMSYRSKLLISSLLSTSLLYLIGLHCR